MKEEQKNKQVWLTPEIYDLDVDKTAGKEVSAPTEVDFFGAS